MATSRFGRSRQMWLLVVANIVLFALLILLIPGITFTLWWEIMLAGIAASGVCVVLFQLWLNATLTRREGTVGLLNRITAGDLSLNAAGIGRTAASQRFTVW